MTGIIHRPRTIKTFLWSRDGPLMGNRRWGLLPAQVNSMFRGELLISPYFKKRVLEVPKGFF